VYAQATVGIGPHESAEGLRRRLTDVGAELLVSSLTQGLGAPTLQDGEVTYAEKITKDDLHIDWTAPATSIVRQVRVGGAWTEFRGDRFKVWDAREVADPGVDGADGAAVAPLVPGALHGSWVGTGEGVLELLEVQAAGKPRQAMTAWANGARPTADDRLV
jgi:methionyl-tRNA formyltransferase